MQHSDSMIIQKIIREIEFATRRIKNITSEEFMTDEDAQLSERLAQRTVGKTLQ